MPDPEHEEWLQARNKARGKPLNHHQHHTPRKKAEDEKKKGDDPNAWRYRGPLDTD